MLVSLAFCAANFSRHLTQNPQRKPVEYRLLWVPNANSLRWPCTFHFFCVDFIRVGLPMQPPFPAEYGLKCLKSVDRFLQGKSYERPSKGQLANMSHMESVIVGVRCSSQVCIYSF